MYDWDETKNEILKRDRGVSFEEVVYWIEHDCLVGIEAHPNQKKYLGQKIYLVNIEGYVYMVPCVEQDDAVFLKTIIPSRKATKKYLKGTADETR